MQLHGAATVIDGMDKDECYARGGIPSQCANRGYGPANICRCTFPPVPEKSAPQIVNTVNTQVNPVIQTQISPNISPVMTQNQATVVSQQNTQAQINAQLQAQAQKNAPPPSVSMADAIAAEEAARKAVIDARNAVYSGTSNAGTNTGAGQNNFWGTAPSGGGGFVGPMVIPSPASPIPAPTPPAPAPPPVLLQPEPVAAVSTPTVYNPPPVTAPTVYNPPAITPDVAPAQDSAKIETETAEKSSYVPLIIGGLILALMIK